MTHETEDHPRVDRFATLAVWSFGTLAEPVLWEIADRFRCDAKIRTSRVMFNPKTKLIHQVRLCTDAPDLTLAHEFGHCLHSFYWPNLTTSGLRHKAERLALWCEGRLTALNLDDGSYRRWQQLCLKPISENAPGPYRVAAQWLLEHAHGKLDPYIGAEVAGPELMRRAKAVFHGD